MGWVTMSERDVQRIGVLSEVIADRRTIASAAGVLAVSVRHVRRLLQRLEVGGGAALVHRARGRPPNNRIHAGIRDYVLALISARDRAPAHKPLRMRCNTSPTGASPRPGARPDRRRPFRSVD